MTVVKTAHVRVLASPFTSRSLSITSFPMSSMLDPRTFRIMSYSPEIMCTSYIPGTVAMSSAVSLWESPFSGSN